MMQNSPRRVSILGATGSIGASTLDIIAQAQGKFCVEAVASARDVDGLAEIARRFNAKFAAICDESLYGALKDALAGTDVEIGAGEEAIIEAALRPAEIVVAAISGAAGVRPTYAAVAQGRTIGLANKECLVCAGGPFMRGAAQFGAVILPFDSEHDAIWQSLGGAPPESVEQMVITASGGPFRTWSAEQIAAATLEEALNHPNWSMGRKITIDSASMMNKGLELIEAQRLFGVAPEKLGVLVHAESIIHGMATFADGSVVACLYAPDMRVPIAHGLAYPERIATNAPRLDLAEIGALHFERPDYGRFPALRIAMDAMKAGGALPTVLNAANEIAVEAFLDRRIGFGDIARLVSQVCEAAVRNGIDREPATIEDALLVDHVSRKRALDLLASPSTSGMVMFQ